MKKIRLFSTKKTKGIEGEEADLYVNFYLVLNRNYIFTFLIDAPNLSCSDRHPIKLWKHFLIMLEEENVKYMRRYERMMYKNDKRRSKDIKQLPSVTPKPKTGHWIEGQTDNPNIHNIICSRCIEGYPSKGHANSQYTREKFKYCPNCGAKMIEPQESEE